jgi:hypothetical protein
MRWLVLLLALVGAGGSAFIGTVLMALMKEGTNEDVNKGVTRLKEEGKDKIPAEVMVKIKLVTRFCWSYVFFFAAAGMGLIAGIYAVARRKFLAFLLFFVAVSGPYALTLPFLLDIRSGKFAEVSIEGKKTELSEEAKAKSKDAAEKLMMVLGGATGALPLAGLLSLLIGRPRPAGESEEA